MLMPDVNILVYAHRAEMEKHERYAAWLTALATGPSPFALSEIVMHGFVRVVTNPKIFDPPSTLAQAFEFLDELMSRRQCTILRPGPEHWRLYRMLSEQKDARGKLSTDAVHAALAVEFGCEWVSADTDFARFVPTLRFQHL